MSEFKHLFTLEDLSKVAYTIDFIMYLVRMVTELMKKLCDSVDSLPSTFSTIASVMTVNDTYDALICFTRLATGLTPSEKICSKVQCEKFLRLHSAFMYYYYDALMLLNHSLLSAFTSYYSTAYSELRASLESMVRGIIFDFLTIPEYRREVKELLKIKGFKGAKGFPELLNMLDKELGYTRPEVSAKIFDIIDKKLKDFNPRATFVGLLRQLREWSIIDDEDFKELCDYYIILSKYSHRVHPRFSEVGIRVITDRDWLSLEPAPEELFVFLYNFTNLNGWFSYLTIKVYMADIVQSEYLRCIDWNSLAKILERVRRLAEEYKSWGKVLKIVEGLKGKKDAYPVKKVLSY